jgi:long-chain acyl-CoA synthetase
MSTTMSTTGSSADDSLVHNRAPSVARMFLDRVAETPTAEAYRFPDGDRWVSRTWAETGAEVEVLAAGLIALGVDAEQRVAICANTRYEWIATDLAIMCAGAATTTVYPSTLGSDVAYILADADCHVVFAEDDEQVAKIRERRSELPSLAQVVTFDGTADAGADGWVITLAQLEELGRRHLGEHGSAVAERVAAIQPEDLATLIYTSGTTGRPKGVRLQHRSWTYEGAAVAAIGILRSDDLQFLWLPMSHAFGKVLLNTQLAVGFPTAVDGRVDRIVENLAVVRPTWMGAAPRIFEKAYGRVTTMAHSEGKAKAAIFDWAVGVGRQVSRARRDNRPLSPLLRAQHAVADRLVFAKVRDRFGGRVRFFVSGSAALSTEVAEWFHGAGILILEGYGLTESSAGSCLNRPEGFRLGSIGTPLPGTEFRIAEDGEVLIQGPGVMEGYHGLPAATTEALDSDGWLHTGDVGTIDDAGFVWITDRKKDLFKTSGGKYVAPSYIEGLFKSVGPLASQMLVHGHDRNYCTAIVTLDPDAVSDWAASHDMAGRPYAEVVGSAAMATEVQRYIDELNAKLNRWETIKKYIVLDHDLSVESGELTPSMKVKRRVVERNYQDKLDELYQ